MPMYVMYGTVILVDLCLGLPLIVIWEIRTLSVRNLGVNFDSALDKQINAVVRSSFLQLRLLSKAKSFCVV